MTLTGWTDVPAPGRHLGKLPAKSDTRALHLAQFLRKAAPPPPATTTFWRRRAAFPLRTFGNTGAGDCTRASQAIMAMRMERLECRRTPSITDDEVLRVYYQMTEMLYGGGDTGAYETDALSAWRNPDLTFRDTQGRPLTIDAFLAVDPHDLTALKQALVASGAHGVKACFNLPLAFQSAGASWDVPAGQPLIGDWQPGSWGGHSTYLSGDYDAVGPWHPTTWGESDIHISWRAIAAYCDEIHIAVDSLDAWKAKPAAKLLDLPAIKAAVNAVSSHKIK